MQSFLLSKDELNAYLNDADNVIAEKQKVLAVLEKEQEGLKKETDKFYDQYMSDNISEDGFERRYRPLEERMEQLDAEMPRLLSEIDFLKVENLSAEHAFAETQTLAERWDILSYDE